MYVQNKTLAPIHIGKNRLMPGANVIAELDVENAVVKSMIDDGKLVVVDEKEASVSEKRNMINESYSEETLNNVEEKLGKDKEALNETVNKRRKILKDMDAELEKAAEKGK